MKKAMKAFMPGDKLYNMERIHSKLVHLSTIDDAIKSKNEDGQYLIDTALSNLLNTLECFNEFGENKSYINYKVALKQALSIIEKFRTSDNLIVKRAMSYCHGEFVKYRREYKKQIAKFCEIEYQGVVVPLFELDQKYIKGQRLTIDITSSTLSG